DVVLCAFVAHLGLVPGLVTAGTEGRHITGKRGRRRLVLAQGTVRLVAIRADRSVRAAFRGQHTVGTLAVLGDYLGMTDGTIHLGCHGAARRQVRRSPASVTLYASGAGMARPRHLGLIHEER